MVHEGTSWAASVDAAAPVILFHHLPITAARYTLRAARGYVAPSDIHPMERAGATVEYTCYRRYSRDGTMKWYYEVVLQDGTMG